METGGEFPHRGESAAVGGGVYLTCAVHNNGFFSDPPTESTGNLVIHMKRVATVISVGALALASACGEELLVGCPGEIRPAIEVVVSDGTTGTWIANGATGLVRDGEYVDSLTPYTWAGSGALVSLSAASGRPGTYFVTIQKDGYRPWQQIDVEALDSHCGVRTTTLHAYLAPVVVPR